MKNLKEMYNSELLTYFLISRDNIISIRRALFDNKDNQHLKDLFDSESKKYDELLKELYRRMEEGR